VARGCALRLDNDVRVHGQRALHQNEEGSGPKLFYPIIALSLEALLLFGGMIMYLRRTRPLSAVGRLGPPIFSVLMLAIQGYIFFGPPPASPIAAAVTALVSYVVFAAVAHWLDRNREPAAA
jgi:hypothetical protein